jgi:hypothetical protein
MAYAYSVFINGGYMAASRCPQPLRRGYRELDPVAILRWKTARATSSTSTTARKCARCSARSWPG